MIWKSDDGLRPTIARPGCSNTSGPTSASTTEAAAAHVTANPLLRALKPSASLARMTRGGPVQVERTRVAWVDTDAGGRIHFTAAFRWAELAETALLRSLVLLDEWADYPRRAVEAEYLAVLRFDDEFKLELVVDRVGTSSITYAWEISRGDEVCIRGRHTAVHVDSGGRPAPLPPSVRNALVGAG